jgi:osmotically-inducible protein OsmY
MNIANRFLLFSVSMVLVSGLAACDKNSAQTAGKSIDQAIDTTSNKISETSRQAGEQSDKIGEALDDTAITAKVKAAILAEPGLKVLQIHVDTVSGITTLSGSVDSQQNGDKAKSIAAAVTGVKNVENQLQVSTGR